MSWIYCEKCNHSATTTSTPNKVEGYFVTSEVWDARQSNSLDELEKEEGNKPVFCERCPNCGHIKVINEPNKLPINGGSSDIDYRRAPIWKFILRRIKNAILTGLVA